MSSGNFAQPQGGAPDRCGVQVVLTHRGDLEEPPAAAMEGFTVDGVTQLDFSVWSMDDGHREEGEQMDNSLSLARLGRPGRRRYEGEDDLDTRDTT